MSGLAIQSGPSFSPENYTTSTNAASSQQSFMQQLIEEIEQIIEEISQMQGGSGGSGGGLGSLDSPGGTSPSPSLGSNDLVSPGSSMGASPVPTSSGGASPAGAAGPTDTGAAGGSTLGPGFPQQLEPYRQDIENASQQTGVPANILAAQIMQESGGDAGATSTNVNGMTDQGLMQVDPATFASLQQQYPQLQGQSLSNPATNIMAGACYMADMGQQFGGNWQEALRAYNSGPSQVDPSNLSNCTDGDPNYVNSVMNYVSMIQNGGQSS
jgi:Transglycosylase SLT domain